MNSKSLMIGDWVYVTGRFISAYENGTATSGIISDIETRAAKINCLTDHAMYVDAPTSDKFWFEPIPLTSEILEKNGFYKNATPNEYEYNYEVFDIFYNIKHSLVIIELCGRTCYEFTIGYVHELQHALRLCGLNEMANNFEV